MKNLFETCSAFTERWEGGLVDNPHDPGGITKFGVSLRLLKQLGLSVGDIDHDGDIDAADIRGLTIDQARGLFKSVFFDQYAVADFPVPVAVAYYDSLVNMGPKEAGRCMQRAANFYPNCCLDEDGIVGKATRMCVKEICRVAGAEQVLAARMIRERGRFYRVLSKNHPDLARFLNGWLARVGDLTVYVKTL